MKRIIYISALGLLILLVSIAGFTLTSTTALRWILQWVVQASGGEFSVSEVNGNLLGPIDVAGLRFENAGVAVKLGKGRLQWQPLRLFSGVVRIDTLTLKDLDISPKPAPPKQKTPTPMTIPEITLPVAVDVREMNIAHFRIFFPGAESPLLITQAQLVGGMNRQGIQLEKLNFDSSFVRLQLEGSLLPTGDYPLNLQVQWQTDLSQFGVNDGIIKGATKLSGTLIRQLKLTQDTQGTVQSHLQGLLSDIFSKPHWQAELSLQELHPQKLQAQAPPGTINAILKSEGEPEIFSWSGSVRGALDDYGNLNSAFQGTVKQSLVELEKLVFTHPHSGGRVSAAGKIRFDQIPPQIELAGDWVNLKWPLSGAPEKIRSKGAAFGLTGTPNAYNFHLDGHIQPAAMPPAKLSIGGSGGQESINLSSIRLDTLDGQMTGNAILYWSPKLKASASLQAKDLKPGKFYPDWPGSLNAAIAAKGEFTATGPQATVQIEKINGRLRGYPLAVTGDVQWEDNRLHHVALNASSGSARLYLRGTVTDAWNLNCHLQVPRLEHVFPDTRGTLSLHGKIDGPLQSPRIAGTISARQAQWDGYVLGQLKSDFKLSTDREAPLIVNVAADAIDLPDQHWDRLLLQGKGSGMQHTLSAQLNAPDRLIHIALAGGLIDKLGWRGQLLRANTQIKGIGEWQLRAPGDLALGPDAMQFGPWCWQHEISKLCLTASMAQSVWSANVTLTQLQLSLVALRLPPGLTIDGSLSGDIDGRWSPQEALLANANLRTSPVTFHYEKVDRTKDIKFEAGSINIQSDASGLRANLHLPFEHDGRIDGVLTLTSQAQQALMETPMRGNVELNIPNLNKFEFLLPQIKNLAGRISGKIRLDGSLAQPVVQGAINMADAGVDIPMLGISLAKVKMDVTSAHGVAQYTGSMQSDEGILNFSGRTQLNGEKGWPTTFKLKGEDFKAAAIPEALLYITPDIEIAVANNQIHLDGELAIPRARFQPEKLPKGTVPVSGDVVVVAPEGEKTEPVAVPWKFFSSLRVILGDRVQLEGYGLRGRLTGNVLLIDEPDKFTVGRGELAIEKGVYQAYGQDLKIERGRFIFADTVVSNPGLDVRATRSARAVVAGVRVTGTLVKPKLELYSNPAMPDAEVLSYLMTGRPLRDASAGEKTSMMSAATALSLMGGESVIRDMRDTFGLEEVSVENGGASNKSQLVLGRYLSPRLYIRYAMGIFDNTDVVQLRYELGKRLQIQTEKGESSGADIFYTIEKKKRR